MNLIDRAFEAVAPRYAVRRQVARAQLSMLRRAVPSQRKNRRADSNWHVNDPATRRAEMRLNRPMNALDRAALRHTFATNPFAVKVKGAMQNNLIGFGITGTVSGSKALRELWANWIEVCDYDGVYDLYGIQDLAASEWLDDGEVFIVKRIVVGAAHHPLRLQVLSVDQLDTTAALADTRIRDGIEYKDGRPAAYHFKRSIEVGTYGDPVRVPADQVIHLFHRRRAGQWRGRPLFEPVLDVLNDVDDYLEAEGIRKKISACFVGFRAPSLEGDDPAMGTVNPDGPPEDPNVPPEEAFYPGMIINGRPGETMTFGDPKADAGIGEYMRWGGIRIGAGSQVTYERATGDLSNVNYSSYKAGDLEFQRFVGRLQWLLFIPRLCREIEKAWVETGTTTGLLPARRPKFKWTPPPFGSVDLGKDVKAKREQVAGGQESLRNVVAENGYDLDELTDEIVGDIAMIQKKFEAKGLAAIVPSIVAALFGFKASTGGSNEAQTAE